MKQIIYNKIIPLPGFTALTIWPPRVARRCPLLEHDERHERIHLRQQFEIIVMSAVLLAVAVVVTDLSPWWLLSSLASFYVLYFVEWLVRLAVHRDRKEAYRNISTEQEAYKHQWDADYLDRRRPFAWVGYLFRKTYHRL